MASATSATSEPQTPGHYNCWMEGAALEQITGTVLAALAGGEAIDATALTFLLRRYGATDRPDLRGALEPALAAGLESQALARTVRERAAWLALFAEALTLSVTPA
jgi:hypothetical protein